MTEPHCLCEQCKMTVLQCKERFAQESSDKVLEELDLWLSEFLYIGYSEGCVIRAVRTKIVELRTKER